MIVDPPFHVCQRAWECAHVLRQHYDDRLPLADRVQCEEVLRAGADVLGWEDVHGMLRLARSVIEVRT